MPARPATVTVWIGIPRRLRRAVAGMSRRDLSRRVGADRRTVAEYVHHIVEANLVAASIVLAALGSPGSEYDWSWLVPDDRWMKRLGYDHRPIEPALRLLDALAVHLGGLLRESPAMLRRSVRLRGSSGLQRRTVARILREECDHAEQHLRDIRSASRSGGRRTNGA
jgi:hypothetical protein